MLAARDPLLMGEISARLAAYTSAVNVLVVDDPPVVGAALLGLDAIGASQDVQVAARSALLARTKAAEASDDRLADV